MLAEAKEEKEEGEAESPITESHNSLFDNLMRRQVFNGFPIHAAAASITSQRRSKLRIDLKFV